MNDRTSSTWTRRLASPTIKSWRKAEEAALLSVIADFVDALPDQRLVLDLQAELDASAVGDRLQAMDLAHTRRRPSEALLHRVERAAGIYTQPSALSVAVRLRSGAEARALLAGDALWNGEFVLYPEPSMGVARLPDPHLQRETFVGEVDWSLGQETGGPDWTITARAPDALERIANTVLDAFIKNALTVEVR